MRVTRRLAVVAAAALAGVTACSGTPAKPTATTTAETPCAWPSLISVQTSNTVVPDSAAAYWVQPIEGTSTVHLSGRYPDARYFSLSVYTPYGASFTSNGVGSSLPDYQIAAAQGSVNPWQHSGAAGGSYEIDLSAVAASGQHNVLPLPPGTSTAHPGYLIYRVYVPAAGSFSQAPLPSISISHGSTTTHLSSCTTRTTPVWPPERAPASAPSPAATPPPNSFFEPAMSQSSGLLPNADASYVEAYIVRPPAGDVVVVTGKAPTSTRGSHPSPWPTTTKDMRYWSLCAGVGAANVPTVANRLPGGQTDYGCRDDDSTAVDPAGRYTYVLGSESQSAQISAIPGATFLPFETTSTAKIYILLLRNLLIGREFDHAPPTVTTTGTAAAASAAMGPYYPTIRTCPLATVHQEGCT
jgi:hypothetical protein